MARSKEAVENVRRLRLEKKFGTADILEILGPAGTIPPTQSLSQRLIELGVSQPKVSSWIKTYIPSELYSKLEPYQKTLRYANQRETCIAKFGGPSSTCDPAVRSKQQATCLEKYGSISSMGSADVRAKRAATMISRYGFEIPVYSPELLAKQQATCQAKYGGNSPFSSQAIRDKAVATFQSKYGVSNPLLLDGIKARIAATNLARYGAENPFDSEEIWRQIKESHNGHPRALPPDEVLRRLAFQDLEPLEPIDKNSDSYSSIHVRCKKCGKEFDTYWSAQPARFTYLGFKMCECQSHLTHLQTHLLEYVRLRYHSAHQWSSIPWMDNQEIDIYIPELKIGFEINGYLSHNATLSVYPGRQPKSVDFHANKTTKCLEHGIKLYHIWHSSDSDVERFEAKVIIDAALSGALDKPKVEPGDTISRDILPDPSLIDIPCRDLGPQQINAFISGKPVVCYTSGLWQFYTPEKSEIQNGTSDHH